MTIQLTFEKFLIGRVCAALDRRRYKNRVQHAVVIKPWGCIRFAIGCRGGEYGCSYWAYQLYHVVAEDEQTGHVNARPCALLPNCL